jgi:hypothetical protein
MTEPAKTPGEKFEEFLLKEYDNIAQAHFNTVNTISAFFRYYLLIVALPVPLLALVTKERGLLELLHDLGGAVPAASVLIALVGLLVMCYVCNLRFDALLYARAVNGIRKHFAENSGLGPEALKAFLVLPTKTDKPPYFEGRYFLFVVLAFALLDSAYPFGGLLFWVDWCCARWVSAFVVAGGFFALHLLAYWWLSVWRERQYLK